jgi:hypothetical protein
MHQHSLPEAAIGERNSAKYPGYHAHRLAPAKSCRVDQGDRRAQHQRSPNATFPGNYLEAETSSLEIAWE